jgi:catalase
MKHKLKTLLKWLAVAVGAYLVLVLLVFAGQMVYGALRDPDADLKNQSMDPAVTEIIEDVRRIVAANRTPTYQRDAHAKPHGCVRAVFEVPEAEARYRHGLFAEPGRYQAWVRFSNGTVPSMSDTKADARGMAIKVMGVEGEQLLDPRLSGSTQDFLMVNSPQFFIRSIAEYVALEKQQADNTPFRYFFGDNSPNPFKWKMRQLYLGLSSRKTPGASPLSDQYFSMSAYRLGPHTIKFSAKACEDLPAEGVDRSNPNFLRDAMKAILRQRDACFQFMVQVRDEDKRMPVEDTTVAWSEKDAPFVPVARVFIPRQDFDTPEQNALCENLSYNPWHGTEPHRPLGAINELRRDLYLHTAGFRRGRNEVPQGEPDSWCDALPSYCRNGEWQN